MADKPYLTYRRVPAEERLHIETPYGSLTVKGQSFNRYVKGTCVTFQPEHGKPKRFYMTEEQVIETAPVRYMPPARSG